MSKAELLAQRWFHTFNNHRMLFGFSALIMLTVCSIYFNFRLGQLNSNPSDMTRVVMPTAYSFLDVSALVFAMCLFGGLIKSFLLKMVSWVWFGYLVALSLFACLSCILALDAQNASSGDEFKRHQLVIALAQANDSVKTWQSNVDNADKFKSKHQKTLNQVTAHRDQLINDISKLDASTPSSQVIFEKGLAIMPVWVDEDQFRLFARLSFGFAMIITPLLLTGVLCNVLGDGRERGVASLGKPQTTNSDKQPEWSSQPLDQQPLQNHNVVRFEPKQPETSELDLFEERGPGTSAKRTRKTGIDRDIADKIINYLANGNGPIGQKHVAKEFGVGKGLLVQVYQEAADQGYIHKSGTGPTSPWKRTSREAQG